MTCRAYSCLPWYDRKLYLWRLLHQAKDRARQAQPPQKRLLYKLEKLDNAAQQTEHVVCRGAWCRILGLGETQVDQAVNCVKEFGPHILPDQHGKKVLLVTLLQAHITSCDLL